MTARKDIPTGLYRVWRRLLWRFGGWLQSEGEWISLILVLILALGLLARLSG